MKTLRLHLHTWGTKLRRTGGLFEVTNVTAKGKVVQTRTFAAAAVRSIQLNEGTTVSADAIRLALENDVDLIFQDRRGMPIGRVTSPRLGSTARTHRGQLRLAEHPEGLRRTRDWLVQKIDAQQEVLAAVPSRSQSVAFCKQLTKTQKQLDKQRRKLQRLDFTQSLADLRARTRGLEGTAARSYFAALGAAPPKPFRFARRSRRPAVDAFNAALNYGYGMLYGYVERSLLRAGLSPYIGFLHRDDYRYKALVYDFIEPYRPAVDATVLQCFRRGQLTADDFAPGVDSGGGILIGMAGRKRLADAVDKRLCVQTQSYRQQRHTLEHQLQLEAHTLATFCAEFVTDGAETTS